jgi:Trp operon repressor
MNEATTEELNKLVKTLKTASSKAILRYIALILTASHTTDLNKNIEVIKILDKKEMINKRNMEMIRK